MHTGHDFQSCHLYCAQGGFGTGATLTEIAVACELQACTVLTYRVGRFRHGPKQGYFKAISVEEKPEVDGGFNFVFDWTANSKTVNEDTTFEFIPPVYSG